jgi:hypothetical protein
MMESFRVWNFDCVDMNKPAPPFHAKRYMDHAFLNDYAIRNNTKGANSKPVPRSRDREAPVLKHKARSRAQSGALPSVALQHVENSRFSNETLAA